MFSFLGSKKLDVLEVFFEEPGARLSIRELSRRSGVSTRWVSETVSEMEDRDILEEERDGNMRKVSAGEDFSRVKRVYNLDRLFESGLVEKLEEELYPDALVLFGSYERGEDRESSDIDLAVVNGREEEPGLEEFEEELDREINLVHLEESSEGDENFRNSLANGTVLSGFLEVV